MFHILKIYYTLTLITSEIFNRSLVLNVLVIYELVYSSIFRQLSVLYLSSSQILTDFLFFALCYMV